jgi:hypothetical protein
MSMLGLHIWIGLLAGIAFIIRLIASWASAPNSDENSEPFNSESDNQGGRPVRFQFPALDRHRARLQTVAIVRDEFRWRRSSALL